MASVEELAEAILTMVAMRTTVLVANGSLEQAAVAAKGSGARKLQGPKLKLVPQNIRSQGPV